MKGVDKQNLIYPSPTVKNASIGAVFSSRSRRRDRFGHPWNYLGGCETRKFAAYGMPFLWRSLGN
jgi:hypothetical protein